MATKEQTNIFIWSMRRNQSQAHLTKMHLNTWQVEIEVQTRLLHRLRLERLLIIGHIGRRFDFEENMRNACSGKKISLTLDDAGGWANRIMPYLVSSWACNHDHFQICTQKIDPLQNKCFFHSNFAWFVFRKEIALHSRWPTRCRLS